MSQQDDYWADAVDKSQTDRGNFWKPGKYIADIVSCIDKKGHTGRSVIISCAVVESDNPLVKPGTVFSSVLKPDTNVSAKGAIASFLRVCKAIHTRECTDDPEALQLEVSDFREAFSPAQPLTDTRIGVEVVTITTNAGRPFDLVKYRVPEKLRLVHAA